MPYNTNHVFIKIFFTQQTSHSGRRSPSSFKVCGNGRKKKKPLAEKQAPTSKSKDKTHEENDDQRKRHGGLKRDMNYRDRTCKSSEGSKTYVDSEKESAKPQSNKPRSNTWKREEGQRDRSKKYCDFHKANGHTTQECYSFRSYLYSKYHIEGLSRHEESPPRSHN